MEPGGRNLQFRDSKKTADSSLCPEGNLVEYIDLQVLKKSFGSVPVREQFFFGLEFRGMHATAAAAQFHGMFQVQHFVINDVLHSVVGNSGVIEDAAHDDGIVGRIVVAKPVAGVIAAPSHPRPAQQAEKESGIQVVENIF